MFERNTTSALASEFRIRVAWRARNCVVNNRLRPFGYAQGTQRTQRTPLIANTYPCQPHTGGSRTAPTIAASVHTNHWTLTTSH